MRYIKFMASVGLSALALTLPAAVSAHSSFFFGVQSAPSYRYYNAPGYGYYQAPRYGSHHREHDELREQHGDIHDSLNEEHALAHEQDLSSWEHAQLHDELAHQHDQADYGISREHQRQHRYRSWQRSYPNNSYYGYNRY